VITVEQVTLFNRLGSVDSIILVNSRFSSFNIHSDIGITKLAPFQPPNLSSSRSYHQGLVCVPALIGTSLALLHCEAEFADVSSSGFVLRLNSDRPDSCVVNLAVLPMMPNTLGAIAQSKGRSVGRQSVMMPKKPSKNDQ
jgi:hypothetical protein